MLGGLLTRSLGRTEHVVLDIDGVERSALGDLKALRDSVQRGMVFTKAE